MTHEDALNIFIEQHRLCSPLDLEADMGAELSMASSINEWRWASDLLSWWPLAQFLNGEFNINVTADEWRSVLTPASKRTLKDVCELISRHYPPREIKPLKLFGQECLSAAVFRTLLKQLERRQVNVTNIKPSTSIAPYLEYCFSAMIEQITILSKGKQVIDKLEIDKRKRNWLKRFLFIEKPKFSENEIKTFRDLTLKIIEVSQEADNNALTL